MTRPRVIPVLLLRDRALVKTVRFRKPTYIGDPINTMRIFNEKEVDEIVVLDIGATASGQGPQFSYLADIVSESFMPLAYGGGIRTVDDARRLFALGIEKVVINTAAGTNPGLISEIAAVSGQQSVVVSIDVKRTLFRQPQVRISAGTRSLEWDLAAFAKVVETAGAGEILLTSIDREGTYSGYDLEVVRTVTGIVGIPVVANGGASSTDDMRDALCAGASAVAASSMFVFERRHRAVLITYPDPSQLGTLSTNG